MAERVAAAGSVLELAGAMTHFASADEDPEFTAAQLSRFEPFVRELRGRWPGIVVHAANSAATLREPASHFDLVRCGIAVYGCDPMNVDPARARFGAGTRADLVRGGGEASRARGQRRLRPPVGGER